MNLVRRLAGEQIGVIYISHNLDEVFAIGHRVTVLKDGLKVGTFLKRKSWMSTAWRPRRSAGRGLTSSNASG